jgi:hypothetical protein
MHSTHVGCADTFECALVGALERVGGQVVAIQPAAAQAFKPMPLDGDDGGTRSEKPLAVADRRLWTGVEGDARTVAR